MKNRYVISEQIRGTERDKHITAFNRWWNKTIEKAVLEGKQLVHIIINEEFSRKPIDYQISRIILDEMIEKLAAVDKLAELSISFLDPDHDEIPFP